MRAETETAIAAATLQCACGAITASEVSGGAEVDIAAFLSAAARDGWRDIDAEPKAIARLDGGRVALDFDGVCPGCIEWFLRLCRRLIKE